MMLEMNYRVARAEGAKGTVTEVEMKQMRGSLK